MNKSKAVLKAAEEFRCQPKEIVRLVQNRKTLKDGTLAKTFATEAERIVAAYGYRISSSDSWESIQEESPEGLSEGGIFCLSFFTAFAIMAIDSIVRAVIV